MLIILSPIVTLADENDSDIDENQQGDLLDGTMEESDNFTEDTVELPTDFYEAKVLKIEERKLENADLEAQGFTDTVQIVTVKILDGKFKGQEKVIENMNTGNAAYDIWVDKGDKVLLYAELTEDQSEIENIFISDFVRWPNLRNLTLLFIILLILIGGWQGTKALVSLGITAFAIVQFMLPMMLKGHSPIILAILVCLFTTVVTIIIITGFSIKSLSTILGTLSGVLIAGVLSYIMGNIVHLTGLSAQEAQMLLYIPQGISFDFKGLLFAGIIIGALGAVMDVAMSISSAMDEIKNTNPSITVKELVQSGFTVGKDIMGTMSNTLILAYTGSAIPLLLLFMAYETSMLKVINLDLIATEIVRALTGSIGLLASIPITAIVYGVLQRKKIKS